MKIILSLFLLIILLSFSIVNSKSDDPHAAFPVITSLNDLESFHHNDTVVIIGFLRHFEPKTSGKGGFSQYFDVEVLFQDSSVIPVRKTAPFDQAYIGKAVEMTCIPVKSPVHDNPCPPYCQNTSEFWQIKDIIEIQ